MSRRSNIICMRILHLLLLTVSCVGLVGVSVIFRSKDSLLKNKFLHNQRRGSVGRQALTILQNLGAGGMVQEYFGYFGLSPETFQHHLKEEPTELQKLANGLRESLEDLGAHTTDEQVEAWACFLFETYSNPGRRFHRLHHVFEVSDGADSIQTISAFFHDIVYYNVDGGLSPLQAEKLDDVITESEGSVSLKDIEFDPLVSMVISIFGFTPGQVLNPFGGLNEFLSAVVALRCLEGTLPIKFLFQIAACIEATIPFRGKDENGVHVMEHLYNRLRKANTEEIGLGDDELIKATQRAANLQNRDVANFATHSAPSFLSNTWDLMPESNISLRNRQYRVSDYAIVMKKVSGFFEFLNPEVVFNSFRGEPSDEVLTEVTRRAKDNIEIARTYLRCKLLSISVLAALAEQTGGDGPVALFVGDAPQSAVISPRLEDSIDFSRPQNGIEVDERILSLLRDGREAESDFDIKNSPLAAYLYGYLGDLGVKESAKYAVHPMDKENAKRLLDSIPKAAVRHIASACARVATTRESQLHKIVEDYAEL